MFKPTDESRSSHPTDKADRGQAQLKKTFETASEGFAGRMVDDMAAKQTLAKNAFEAASGASLGQMASSMALQQLAKVIPGSANEAHFTLTVDGVEPGQLQVLSFDGFEAISRPYVFQIELVSQHSRFDINSLLSKPAYLALTPDGEQGIHGVIHAVRRGALSEHTAQYSVTLGPTVAHLAKRTNQRIFQHLSVQQIIAQLLEEVGILEQTHHEFRIGPNPLPEREYCVQYDETDLHFIQRLCEEEGIHYHFEHSSDGHLLVFGNGQAAFPVLEQSIRYSQHSGFVADEPVVKSFDVNLASRTKQAMWRDYNFKTVKIPAGTANGALSEKAGPAQEPEMEFYDYPGLFEDEGRAKQLAQIAIERQRTDHLIAEGYGDLPDLCSGHFFTLHEHPLEDSETLWLLNAVHHQGRQPQVLEAFGDSRSADMAKAVVFDSGLAFPDEDFHQGYRNVFLATPEDVVWRPPLKHPKPKVLGSQTAKVTGPAGEEIYCDEYGRVKVQFHWDREGQYDEHSSCWIRVASNWAHAGYGAVVIPRIGMEVLITFLEGDPDRPVITGCLHNGSNTLPYALPADKTRSVFKTNSSPGGNGSNEIRIEDKAGHEEIYLHAQKDQNIVVENNETLTVGVDRVETIGNDSHHTVGNDVFYRVEQNQQESYGKDHIHTVGNIHKDNIHADHLEIIGRNYEGEIAGKMKLDVGATITTHAGQVHSLMAGTKFEIAGPGGKITIDSSGITLEAPKINLKGSVSMGGSGSAQVPTLNLSANDALPICEECAKAKEKNI